MGGGVVVVGGNGGGGGVTCGPTHPETRRRVRQGDGAHGKEER